MRIRNADLACFFCPTNHSVYPDSIKPRDARQPRSLANPQQHRAGLTHISGVIILGRGRVGVACFRTPPLRPNGQGRGCVNRAPHLRCRVGGATNMVSTAHSHG